jgi:hypothetical protein
MIKISSNEIFKKISVRPPYFALKNVCRIGNEFFADIPIEQPLNGELGTISTGEISRHLAILGAVAIGFSFNDDKKDFYYDLAFNAVYEKNVIIEARNLKGRATCELLEKRQGRAKTSLLDDNNNVLATLQVDYHLLTRKLFEKQFAKNKIDLRKNRQGRGYRKNIYKEMLNFDNLQVERKVRAVATINKLTAELCSGHFALYPAFPVAFSSYYICYLVSLILQKEYYIEKANINADALIFVNSDINIQVEVKERINKNYCFIASLEVDEQIIFNSIFSVNEK